MNQAALINFNGNLYCSPLYYLSSLPTNSYQIIKYYKSLSDCVGKPENSIATQPPNTPKDTRDGKCSIQSINNCRTCLNMNNNNYDYCLNNCIPVSGSDLEIIGQNVCNIGNNDKCGLLLESGFAPKDCIQNCCISVSPYQPNQSNQPYQPKPPSNCQYTPCYFNRNNPYSFYCSKIRDNNFSTTDKNIAELISKKFNNCISDCPYNQQIFKF